MAHFTVAAIGTSIAALGALIPAQSSASPSSQPASPEASWPGFRGTGNSHATTDNLPIEWSSDQNLAWSVELAGYGQSSPVVWRNRVFVTAIEGLEKERCQVSCYRAADGFLLWSRGFDSSLRVESTKMVSRAAPTPVVDSDRVYALFESGDLFALDHRGETLWTRALAPNFGGHYQGNHGFGSSLVRVPGGVIALFDHDGPSAILRVDGATGSTRWKTDRESRISWSTPTFDSERGEVIVSSNGSVDGYDIEDGSQRWTVPGITGNTVPSVTVADDLIFVGIAEGKNLALRRTSNGVQVAWRAEKALPSGFGSPLHHRGRVLIINKAGVLCSVDAQTGDLHYKQRLAEPCWASPIASGEFVYVFGKSGKTTVLSPVADSAEVIAENDLATEDTVYGVAVTDDSFYVREGKRLLCIRATEQAR